MAPLEFNGNICIPLPQDEEELNPSLNNINGWYFYCFNSTLYFSKVSNS